MNNPKIKIAVIGLGRLGSFQAQNIVNRVDSLELVAVCAAENQLQWAKDNLNVNAVYTDYKK
ncbi:Gfo/Idh/MocA family oxidoreductase [Bombilactobacillus mellis]|uniref:Gfo/Idh/MocA family oxidoreductase n=1 Tax=Bombilactobacillus mellis TaxID=1218508 RepID=UPI001EEB8353|nr:Gfo/Idh/MocA family oxidoreductase [Bombilactobacillus mellis]